LYNDVLISANSNTICT